MNIKFKSDRFRKNRGGCSRLLNIICKNCNGKVLTYQKDGPGQLKRLYLDRIFEPENLANLHNLAISEISNLTCPNCNSVLAIPYIYKKEQRKAFRLSAGKIEKKILKNN